jgi:hypothetical protein
MNLKELLIGGWFVFSVWRHSLCKSPTMTALGWLPSSSLFTITQDTKRATLTIHDQNDNKIIGLFSKISFKTKLVDCSVIHRTIHRTQSKKIQNNFEIYRFSCLDYWDWVWLKQESLILRSKRNGKVSLGVLRASILHAHLNLKGSEWHHHIKFFLISLFFANGVFCKTTIIDEQFLVLFTLVSYLPFLAHQFHWTLKRSVSAQAQNTTWWRHVVCVVSFQGMQKANPLQTFLNF